MYRKGHKRLLAWQESMELVDHAYSLTKHFPPEEKYCLALQIRRAAISIPLNIAEGYGRPGRKDYLKFLSVAYGSLLELETALEIARRQKLISNKGGISEKLAKTAHLLFKLRESLGQPFAGRP